MRSFLLVSAVALLYTVGLMTATGTSLWDVATDQEAAQLYGGAAATDCVSIGFWDCVIAGSPGCTSAGCFFTMTWVTPLPGTHIPTNPTSCGGQCGHVTSYKGCAYR